MRYTLETWAPQRFHKRFPLRCGLKTLFVVLTVIAVACAAWSMRLRSQRAEERVDNLICDTCPHVFIDPSPWGVSQRLTWQRWLLGYGPRAQSLHLEGYTSYDRVQGDHFVDRAEVDILVEHLHVFGVIDKLVIDRIPFRDADLKFLESFRGLDTLCIENANLTDDALRYIARTRAQYLGLTAYPPGDNYGHMKITDAGLLQLKSMPRLEELDLVGLSELTDSCVSSLSALPKLRELHIEDSGITEMGFKNIRAKCSHLEKLSVQSQTFNAYWSRNP